MKKIIAIFCFAATLILVGSCGFLGDDNEGGDDRGSDPNNDGSETQVIMLEQRPNYA